MSTSRASSRAAITVAVAVVRRQGIHELEFLVGRRSSDAVDGPGLDEFPGGKVEPDESPAEAAARECLEEAGIFVNVGVLLDRASGRCKAGPLDVWFFDARPVGHREPTAPYIWLPLSALAERRFPATNQRVLSQLAADG